MTSGEKRFSVGRRSARNDAWARGPWLLLLAAFGCGGAGANAGATTTAHGAGQPSAAALPPRIEASAPTKEEAVAEAESRLVEQVLGDAAWASIVTTDARLVDAQAFTTENADGGRVKVSLEVKADRIRGFLDRFASASLDTSAAPPMWKETLEAFLTAHRSNLVCTRRQALLDESCELLETSELDAAVSNLFSALELNAMPKGSVPTDQAGQPLRPVTVQLLHAGNPMPGVPLVVGTSAPDALLSLSATTASDGRATFAPGEGKALPNDLVVRVDRATLLGPLRDRVSPVETEAAARAVSMRRWAALVVEHAAGRRTNDRVVAGALGQALLVRGSAGAIPIPVGTQNAFLRLDDARRAQQLPALADELRGEVDVLLVVQADSEYASRMGASRVWFEARGKLQVYNVWNGRLLKTVEASVTADGLGDQRADQAARQKLGQALVEKLAADTSLPWATRSAAR